MNLHTPDAVLITGGCGFIGSNFINYAFQNWPNAKFINLDKLILNSSVNHVNNDIRNSNRYEFVPGDIRNRGLVKNILEQYQVDTIIHFAADCTSVNCYENPYDAIDNNIVSFVHFLEACRGRQLKKFVHISTDEVYGDSLLGSEAQPMTETREQI